MIYRIFIISLISVLGTVSAGATQVSGVVSGKVVQADGTPVDYATVYLKGTNYSGSANERGIYHIKAQRVNILLYFRHRVMNLRN